VSLTLATDELLAELVPLERVAGVTALADDVEISNVAGRYPASIPRLKDTDAERIITLGPDLVCVAPYNTADFLKLLERSGLPTYRNDTVHSLDEIEIGIRALGERVGEPDHAATLVAQMRGQRQELANRLKGVARRPRVLYWSAGFTAGRGTTLDDILREAGAANVAAELGLHGSVALDPERVVTADPDWILLARWSADEREGPIDRHPILRQLPAVREGRVIRIEGRYLTSVSHHALEAVERLARRLHPDRFGPGTVP
jgi:iron complex transport system substrate-binding protein